METLLAIDDLEVHFPIKKGLFSRTAGYVYAVDGVSLTLEKGETLGLVGESGCGKSVHALSIMRLIPSPPGRIEDGEVWFDGRDLLKLSAGDMHHVRGAEIAMVFRTR